MFAGKKDKDGVRPLSYRDCGDSRTHAQILGMFPMFLKEGQGTRLTVKAVLGSNIGVSSGKFFVENVGSMAPSVTTFANLAHCSGTAGEKMACPLKLGVWPGTPSLPLGSIGYSGMNFPIWKGPTTFNLELFLNPLIPELLGSTSTRLRAYTKSGVEFFCLEAQSEPSCCSRNPDCGFCLSKANSAFAGVVVV